MGSTSREIRFTVYLPQVIMNDLIVDVTGRNIELGASRVGHFQGAVCGIHEASGVETRWGPRKTVGVGSIVDGSNNTSVWDGHAYRFFFFRSHRVFKVWRLVTPHRGRAASGLVVARLGSHGCSVPSTPSAVGRQTEVVSVSTRSEYVSQPADGINSKGNSARQTGNSARGKIQRCSHTAKRTRLPEEPFPSVC